MFTEFKNTFKNDHIYFKKGYVRAFSPLWWIIRVGQCALGVGMAYVFYCLMWLVMGP